MKFLKVIVVIFVLVNIVEASQELTPRMNVEMEENSKLKIQSNYLTHYLIRGINSKTLEEGNDYEIISPADEVVDFNIVDFNGDWNGIFPDVDFKPSAERSFKPTVIDISGYNFPSNVNWRNSTLVIRGASITSLFSNDELNTEDMVVLIIYNLFGLINTSMEVISTSNKIDSKYLTKIKKISQKVSDYKSELENAEIYLSLAKVSIEQIKNLIEVIGNEDSQELYDVLEHLELAVNSIDKLANLAGQTIKIDNKITVELENTLAQRYAKTHEQFENNGLDEMTKEFANVYKDETDEEKKRQMVIKFALEPLYGLSSAYQKILQKRISDNPSSTNNAKLQKQINFLQYGKASMMLATIIFAGDDYLEMAKKEPKKLIKMLVSIAKGLSKDILTIDNTVGATSYFASKMGKAGQQLGGKVLKGASYLKAVAAGNAIGNKLLPMIWDLVVSPDQFKLDIVDGRLNRFGASTTQIDLYKIDILDNEEFIDTLENSRGNEDIVIDLDYGDRLKIGVKIEQKLLFDESRSPWTTNSGVMPQRIYSSDIDYIKTKTFSANTLCVKKTLGDLAFSFHKIKHELHSTDKMVDCGAGSWYGEEDFENTDTSTVYESLGSLPSKYKLQNLSDYILQDEYEYNGGVEIILVSTSNNFAKLSNHHIKIVPTIDNLDFTIERDISDIKYIKLNNLGIEFNDDDPLKSYEIDWGDNSDNNIFYTELSEIEHTYSDIGTYTITLTLSTKEGLEKLITKDIAIELPEPDIDLGYDKTKEELTTVVIPLNRKDDFNQIAKVSCYVYLEEFTNEVDIDITASKAKVIIEIPNYDDIQKFDLICEAYDENNEFLTSHSVYINISRSPTKTSPFITVWKTDNYGGESEDDQIIIYADSDNYKYDFSIDWGDGTVDNEVTETIIHTYNKVGIYTLTISGKYPYFTNGSGIWGGKRKLIEIKQWGSQKWQSMHEALAHSSLEDGDGAIDTPNLSQVTDISGMFFGVTDFNQDISDWDVSNITNMSSMFASARYFNGNISNWDVSSVTNMSGMFSSTARFNQNLNYWDVSSVTNMDHMFADARYFNGNISSWDVSNVTNMRSIFVDAKKFNQDIGDWDVSSVTDMSNMFYRAYRFNQDIGDWDVSSVTNMNYMFRCDPSTSNYDFNQDINNWDVSNVKYMSYMFAYANHFNQDISNWDVFNVTSMGSMFRSAKSFNNQNLIDWNVYNVISHSNFLTSTGENNIEPIWKD